jgi:hypothetical protein
MTLQAHPTTVPINPPEPERPVDPRPAWERVAYAWLEREVDHGQPIDPTELAHQVSVAPGFAGDLVRVLRANRQRDPDLGSCVGGWCATGTLGAAWAAGARPGHRRLPDPRTPRP